MQAQLINCTPREQQIISLAESGDFGKAEELLNTMQADAISCQREDMLPDVDCYTALMNAFIEEQRRLSSHDTRALKSDVSNLENFADAGGAVTTIALAEKAQDLLIQMEDLSGVSDRFSSMRLSGSIVTGLRRTSLQPTSHHYDTVISAFAIATTAANDVHYSSHLNKQAPHIASRWLTRMETLSSLTRLDALASVAPTVDSYFYVMGAYAAGDTATASKESKAPLLVQSVFDKLKQNPKVNPTVREYRLLLRTWCGSFFNKDAAYKAMGIWMNMQLLFRGGIAEMEPTLEDGKMVLEAWTRSKNNHSSRRALTVLSTMENAHAKKKTKVQPDLSCYRNVLITMSRSRVPETLDDMIIPKLFKRMEDNHIFPDKTCFDAAIATLKNCARRSKTDSEKYAKATEMMLQRMEKDFDRSSVSVVKPSSITYTNVIQALIVRKKPEAAEKLLRKMISSYEGGDESMRPNRDSYVGTIHAYGSSKFETKYLKANEILQLMIQDYSRGNETACPDVYSFHSVIRACTSVADTAASAEKCKEALMMAISTLQQMKKSDSNHPNARSYTLLLQCASRLLPSGPEREKVLRSIFRSCCKDGLVDRKVLGEFQTAVSADTHHKEVVRNAQSYNGIRSLPEAWTRSLGYRVLTHETEHGGKRTPIISVSGEVIASTAYNDYRMRKRLSKKNQKFLQGGRI